MEAGVHKTVELVDMESMKRLLLRIASIASVAAVLMVPYAAQAVPSLGVATDNGYICDSGESSCPDPYQLYFGGGIHSGPYGGAQEGFIIGPSGDSLIIWSNIFDADIWLLTDSYVFANLNPTINGSALTPLYDTGQFDGYKPTPYYGINLGDVDTNTWTAVDDPFNPHGFYFFEVTLAYTGDSRDFAGHYFFAVADDNGVSGLQANRVPGEHGPDSFSPKTTSAVFVPEPTPLSLMAAGLLVIGVSVITRRRRPAPAA